MIEWDIASKLENDDTLATLLGSGTDPKIYPIRAPQGASDPYILYSAAGTGPEEDVLDELRIQLNCVSSSYKTAGDIRDRVKAILGLRDRVSILSEDYYIYTGKLTGESDLIDTEQNLHHRIIFFNFKYLKKF